MRKLFGLLVMMFIVCSVNAQRDNRGAYIGANVGFNVNATNGINSNSVFNVQMGHFLDYCQAVEFEYTYGFKSKGSCFNRYGLNYKYEFDLPYYCKSAPYFKVGAAYKSVEFDCHKFDNINLLDLKFGLGLSYYFRSNISVNVGIEFTNDFNRDYSFQWKNTLCQFNIGLALNF